MGAILFGGTGLLNYRLYRLDGAGQIDAAEWLEAVDDEEACQKAITLHPSGRYELWEGQRLVDCNEGDAKLAS